MCAFAAMALCGARSVLVALIRKQYIGSASSNSFAIDRVFVFIIIVFANYGVFLQFTKRRGACTRIFSNSEALEDDTYVSGAVLIRFYRQCCWLLAKCKVAGSRVLLLGCIPAGLSRSYGVYR